MNSLLWCKHHSTDSPKRLQMTILPTTMKCYTKYDHDWLCMYGMVFERLDSELKCGILRWLNTYIFFLQPDISGAKGQLFSIARGFVGLGFGVAAGHVYVDGGAKGVLPCFSRFEAQWDSKIIIHRYSKIFWAIYGYIFRSRSSKQKASNQLPTLNSLKRT